jgi:hypothetical protein
MPFTRRPITPSQRRLRVALLNAELDIQRVTADERSRSIQTKASFLVVAAGFLAGSVFGNQPDNVYWWVSILPLALALASVVLSAVALWPAGRDTADPVGLRDKWIDSTETAYALEIYLLKLKTNIYTATQDINDRQVKALKTGFVVLILAIVAAVLVSLLGFTLPATDLEK